MKKVVDLWTRLSRMKNLSSYVNGCALDAFVTCGHLDKAYEIFMNASALGLAPPDMQVTFVIDSIPILDLQTSMLIRAFTHSKRLNDALNVYSTMRATGLEPCDVTYNNLMHTCVVSGDVETALSILHVFHTHTHLPTHLPTHSHSHTYTHSHLHTYIV